MINNSAIVVVDLVNDFVNGVFGSEEAKKTALRTRGFLDKLRGKYQVIFTMDSHLENDPEFRVWKQHCVAGTEGSHLVSELESFPGYRIKKRHFDSFFDSDLDGILRANSISGIFVSGISTDICVLHTVSGAFFRNYDITVISDLCSSIDLKNHEKALEDMHRNYGARIMNSKKTLEELL
ncbi:MAG: isochorismatase family cysteine hydrolase [Thermoplasmataceae archaeon]